MNSLCEATGCADVDVIIIIIIMGAFLKYSFKHSDEIAEITQISSTASRVFCGDKSFAAVNTAALIAQN